LRPGLPPEGIPRTPKPGEVKGFPPYLIQRAEELGLKFKRSPIVPCSRLALEVAEYAKEKGKFEQFHLGVCKTYWEEGKNIGLMSVIRDIASESGLDADEVERCLQEGRFTQVVKAQSEQAKQSGINGIPAYVIGDLLIEGVEPYQFFQKAVEATLNKSQS
jgi:predicted DsbA family dithiol-disulfide isomerase